MWIAKIKEFFMSPKPLTGWIHATMKFRSTQFIDINKAIYEWYLQACSKNIFPGGPQLIARAKEIAERLGVVSFKAGWISENHGST